jgi:hypothetical protein
MSKALKRPRGRPAIGRKQVSLKLQPEIYAALWQLARAAGSSRSEIVEKAVAALAKRTGCGCRQPCRDPDRARREIARQIKQAFEIEYEPQAVV